MKHCLTVEAEPTGENARQLHGAYSTINFSVGSMVARSDRCEAGSPEMAEGECVLAIAFWFRNQANVHRHSVERKALRLHGIAYER